ncbi:MAG: hypothetical protein PHN90_07445 [Methanothrix sp.]|jgi:hypothetical protein|nr:hypothetical protein [Methanothrix sp.]OPX78866.1 MAG: hypothetical protein A4E50_02087 [Methanosaeta sp. PtaB.Bin087]OPY56467.1 MAG: hypothetical protein A4E51_00430 [Methanosaeta sp. PtaU1.Bin055]NLX39772.1 hypothetical protein [Methanothrix sp.]HOI70218.1 hypothetical protein [Methanothrix sp.]
MIDSTSAPMKIVCVKSGYALGPEGSFFKSARPLRIEIEGTISLSPAQIRELLQKGKGIEENMTQIEGETTPYYRYWGEIRIENACYRLVEVSFRRQDTYTYFKANLADVREDDEGHPGSGPIAEVIGEIETVDSGGTAKGRLDINQGIFAGEYTVQLNASAGRRFP